MSEDDELMFVGNLDQPIPADGEELLQRVEQLIMEAIEEHNQWKALNVCKQLRQAQKLSGMGLAHALFLIRKNWSQFNTTDRFEDVAFEYIGLHSHTVARYVGVEDMYEAGYVPPQYRDELRQRNIKDQIPVANAIAQGYTIQEEQWEKIVHAPDFSTVNKIVREEVKKAEPRSTAMMLTMDEMGSIWCFKAGERYFVGSLEVSSDEKAVQQAIERIVGNSGVLRS